ncbi:MAG: hypothetical protein JST00_14220 [Deltaproteobacteria bacterium]|nr:hypothetical protein [Deltaproteobacteria bacterium]
MIAAEVFPGAAFWREAFALHGAATTRVMPRTLVFTALAAAVALVHRSVPSIAIRVDTLEASGLVLGLLLVFRTAAGYERWWEARKLWGEIVNQSRNLVVSARAFGPPERVWQRELTRWVAAFSHATRATLQDQRAQPELTALLGTTEAARLRAAEHMPSYVAGRIAALLRRARDEGGLDPFAFIQLDRERAALLEHEGGCERILKTPIPKVYSVTIRRFVVFYLCAVPFALVATTGLFAPLYALFIAYPILSLEQIGAELQNPFVERSLSHLDLRAICGAIQKNLDGITHEGDEGGGDRG